jgi:hypothetical protein
MVSGAFSNTEIANGPTVLASWALKGPGTADFEPLQAFHAQWLAVGTCAPPIPITYTVDKDASFSSTFKLCCICTYGGEEITQERNVERNK